MGAWNSEMIICVINEFLNFNPYICACACGRAHTCIISITQEAR